MRDERAPLSDGRALGRTPKVAADGDNGVDVSLLLEGEPSLTDRAYSMLEEMIVTLKLAPGTAVSEARLSQALGIGRTPIREALQRLARERLVTILPRRGIFVSEINVKSQLRLLEVRREVERLIARSAARRSRPAERARFAEIARIFERCAKSNDETTFIRTDREFNELCSLAARNEFGAGAMSLMHSLSRRFWFIHYQKAADLPVTAKLHANIARAISRGDEDAAATALDRLIDEIEQFTRATVGAES
jgi:DNA-binding GntR family transcriptional regulator